MNIELQKELREEEICSYLRKMGETMDEDLFADLALIYPNTIQILYYSCLVFEQNKRMEQGILTQSDILQFWKKESDNREEFSGFVNKLPNRGGWPKEISLECTTFCNAKCTNCTHGTLLKSEDRCGVNVDLKEIFYRIRKLRLLTLVSCKEEPKFLPVGLGEPLCHPNMIEILTYAAKFFPIIQITTNAILLTETKAKELLKINIYKIVVSLSYYDQDTYSREIGADFLIVKKNITRLLELRNKLSSKICIYWITCTAIELY